MKSKLGAVSVRTIAIAAYVLTLIGPFAAPASAQLYGTSFDGQNEAFLQIDAAKHQIVSLQGLNLGVNFGLWQHPTNIAFAPDGSLYGTSFDGQNLAFVQIDAAKHQIVSLQGLNLGENFGLWQFPTNIAFAPDGSLYGTSFDGQNL